MKDATLQGACTWVCAAGNITPRKRARKPNVSLSRQRSSRRQRRALERTGLSAYLAMALLALAFPVHDGGFFDHDMAPVLVSVEAVLLRGFFGKTLLLFLYYSCYFFC